MYCLRCSGKCAVPKVSPFPICRILNAISVITAALHLLQEDSSLTRSDAYFLDLLKQADYVVTGSAVQRNFPKGLFKVILRPQQKCRHCHSVPCLRFLHSL